MDTSENKRAQRIDLSIVIPVHDEQDNIEPLYEELVQVLEGMPSRSEIIFVNDGSRDDTARILDQLAGKDQRITVVHLMRNYGRFRSHPG